MTDTDGATPPLRLGVLDVEDLAVVSAHLQDAEASLADMAYLPRQKRFALALSRFDWPLASTGVFARCRCGLHFERVLHVARSGFAEIAPDQTLRLLAITFLPGDAPSGSVVLMFGGGAQIKLTVEVLEAEMRDIGPRWRVEARPGADAVAGDGTRPAAPPAH